MSSKPTRPCVRPALVAAAVLCLMIVVGAARAAAAPIPVTVASAPATAPLPSGFLGIALEYRTLPEWIGTANSASSVDPVFLRLLRNLDPTGRPVIRIGGESTDRTWWPMPHTYAPHGITYSIGPQWATDVRSLAQALDAQLILSANLEADSPALSHYEADELVSSIGTRYVSDLEIGNEPDLYHDVPWYHVLRGKDIPWYVHSGMPVYSRPAGWDYDAFLAQFPRFLDVMPDVPIAGPDAVSTTWLNPFEKRFVSPHGRVRMLDSHDYPLGHCSTTKPGSPSAATIPNMLSRHAWLNVASGAGPSIALAHRDGLQYRIDEMGSVTCDGLAGVSNTMASALWVTNALFQAARLGVSGVNLHSNQGSTNGLFDLYDHNGAWSATIHPLYDGAVMFAQADPVGARQLDVTNSSSSVVHTWATIGADHRVRVLVVNDGGLRAVTVHPPAGYGSEPGTLQYLTAPSASATAGVEMSGEPFDATTTGDVPAPRLQTVGPDHSGAYTVSAPTDSETLLTLSPRPAAPAHRG